MPDAYELNEPQLGAKRVWGVMHWAGNLMGMKQMWVRLLPPAQRVVRGGRWCLEGRRKATKNWETEKLPAQYRGAEQACAHLLSQCLCVYVRPQTELEPSRGHSDGGDKLWGILLALARATTISHWTQPWCSCPDTGSAWSFLEVGGDSSLTCRRCAPVRTLCCQVK